MSISDGIYDAMVDQMLASGAPIEIPFKNYFSFTGGADHDMLAFNVASQSIDRLWGTMRVTADINSAAGRASAAVPNVAGDISKATLKDFRRLGQQTVDGGVCDLRHGRVVPS